nr:2OG-Fe(II) oxygenase [Lysobacter chinensis]
MRRLIDEFPGVEDIPWKNWGAGRTRGGQEVQGSKLGQSDETFFPPFIRHFLAQLNSATFIRFIERLTGISGLITDPTYSGCGLHSTGSGGRLMIHTDANRHPHSGAHLHQILNLIVYLNEDWKGDWGGDLELWTTDRKPHRKIAPIANRAVLFFTGTRSFHGHPEPLTCPPERRRNSLAVYYYTYKREQNEDYEGMQHAARWVPTTAEDRATARELADSGRAQLAAMVGSRIEIPTTALRMPLEPQWGDRLLVTLLDGEGFESTTCEKVPAPHFTSDAAGSNLRAFASITPLTGEHGGDREVVALLAEDGAVHLAKKDETRTHFIGYIAAFLRVLGCANR